MNQIKLHNLDEPEKLETNLPSRKCAIVMVKNMMKAAAQRQYIQIYSQKGNESWWIAPEDHHLVIIEAHIEPEKPDGGRHERYLIPLLAESSELENWRMR